MWLFIILKILEAAGCAWVVWFILTGPKDVLSPNRDDLDRR